MLVSKLLEQFNKSMISTHVMAKRLGVERSCFLRWRKGINSPTLHTAEAFANSLGFELVLMRVDPPKDYRKWLNT